MRHIILLIYLIPLVSTAQENAWEIDFLQDYNEHVDPNHISDTARYLRIVQSNKIWNNQGVDIKKTSTYFFSLEGKSYSIDDKGRRISLSDHTIPVNIPEYERSDQMVKSHLNLINVLFQPNRFQLQEKSDTLVIIREHTSTSNYRDRWFNRDTKHQFRIDHVHVKDNNEKVVRTTLFYDFRRLDCGLLVPARATYTSPFAEAEVEFIEFMFGAF